MESDWAAENLQVIRTLMERGAVYRRALAPVTGCVGVTGVLAAVAASVFKITSRSLFGGFWLAIAALCLGEAFCLVRLQAMKEREPFWSPPTRRVAQAVMPAFVGGCIAGMIQFVLAPDGRLAVWILVAAWLVLYGCGAHAAGFFVPRGFKLLGWAFMACGFCVLVWALSRALAPSLACANAVMGAIFGGGHCACSAYLYFTEQRRNAP